MGQAAGMAAFMALDSGVDTRNIDIKKLQQNLRKIGALV